MSPTKLTQSQIEQGLQKLPDWTLVPDNTHIQRIYALPDFSSALSLVNTIGEQAERYDHHPTIILAWGKVTVTLSTHEADGLTEKDFALAQAIERVAQA